MKIDLRGSLKRMFNAFGTVSHFADNLYGMRCHKYGRVVEGVKQLYRRLLQSAIDEVWRNIIWKEEIDTDNS